VSNTSATGGYLLGALPPINGLRNFIHDLIVGVSGIDAKLVRPRWQPNPPTIPTQTTDWCAFGVVKQIPDNSGYISAGDLMAELKRHELVEVLCSFYGPSCLGYAGLFRDGLEISQNREALFLADMGLAFYGDTIHTPELINEIWYDRADFSFTLRREIKTEYAILSLLKAQGMISTPDSSENWETQGV